MSILFERIAKSIRPRFRLGLFLSGSLFQVHCSAFFSPCSPWRFFVDDGSHEHNRDRIRFNHSTVRFRFDPIGQDPPPTLSATENFTAVHMMLRFAFTMWLATWSR